MDDLDESPRPRRAFGRHAWWWWATAAVTAVGVIGAVVLLTLPT